MRRKKGIRRAAIPQRVAQELLGHQTPSIFSRYNIVSDQDLREAPKKLMEYMNNQAVEKPIENPPEGFRALGARRQEDPG
jgi:hypothetical protein